MSSGFTWVPSPAGGQAEDGWSRMGSPILVVKWLLSKCEDGWSHPPSQHARPTAPAEGQVSRSVRGSRCSFLGVGELTIV